VHLDQRQHRPLKKKNAPFLRKKKNGHYAPPARPPTLSGQENRPTGMKGLARRPAMSCYKWRGHCHPKKKTPSCPEHRVEVDYDPAAQKKITITEEKKSSTTTATPEKKAAGLLAQSRPGGKLTYEAKEGKDRSLCGREGETRHLTSSTKRERRRTRGRGGEKEKRTLDQVSRTDLSTPGERGRNFAMKRKAPVSQAAEEVAT